MSSKSLASTVPFEDILDELEVLARDHLLLYRVQVGGVFLKHFWNDNPADFSSKDANRSQRFQLFFEKYGENLTRYGLSQRKAKDSIRACIVVRTLPTEIAQQLFLSQILELARLHDPTRRVQVAHAAIESDWSIRQLRGAITAVRAGLPLDADVDTPGIQPQQPEQYAGRLPAGRLVTRAVKLSNDLKSWRSLWTDADVSRLQAGQKRRLREAVAELEEQVGQLRRELGE